MLSVFGKVFYVKFFEDVSYKFSIILINWKFFWFFLVRIVIIFWVGVLLFLILRVDLILFIMDFFIEKIFSDRYVLIFLWFFLLFDCNFIFCRLFKFEVMVLIFCELIISFNYFGNWRSLYLSMLRIFVLLFVYLFKVLMIIYYVFIFGCCSFFKGVRIFCLKYYFGFWV